MDTLKVMVVAGVTSVALIGILLLTGTVQAPSENVGAMSSPDIMSKYINIGGALLQTQAMTPIQATSSVICSLQSPAATSTLLSGGITLTSATGSATSLSISKSVQPYVIGNLLASSTVASGAFKTLEAPATSTVGGNLFAPNTYFVVAQGAGGVLNQTGNCSAIWHTP